MFVVPDLSVGHPPARQRPRARRRATPVRRSAEPAIPVWLLAWLGVGIAALVLVPALRGDAATGATWPFWLAGAPLIDLAWLRWRRLLASLRVPLRRLAAHARRVRGVRQSSIRWAAPPLHCARVEQRGAR